MGVHPPPFTGRREGLPTKDLSIASGASVSNTFALKGYLIVGIVVPTGWDAAAITFQVSPDNVTWYDLFDDTAELSFTSAAAGRFIRVLPEEFAGVAFVRVRSGTSGVPVNQSSARTITLVIREA